MKYETRRNETGLTLIGSDDDMVGAVVLPSEIDGVPVTAIGDSMAWGCTRLTTLVIPDSVTIIGDGLAEGCPRLAETARWRMTSRGWLAHDLRPGLLTIGCQSHPVKWWAENAESIAAKNYASLKEVAELKAVIEKFGGRNIGCRKTIDRHEEQKSNYSA
jgi:hypothetical protein